MQRAIAVLRIFCGLVFLSNGLAKFVPGIAHLPGGYFLIDSQGAKSIIQHNASHHPVRLYHDLVFNLFLPAGLCFSPRRAIDAPEPLTRRFRRAGAVVARHQCLRRVPRGPSGLLAPGGWRPSSPARRGRSTS